MGDNEAAVRVPFMLNGSGHARDSQEPEWLGRALLLMPMQAQYASWMTEDHRTQFCCQAVALTFTRSSAQNHMELITLSTEAGSGPSAMVAVSRRPEEHGSGAGGASSWAA